MPNSATLPEDSTLMVMFHEGVVDTEGAITKSEWLEGAALYRATKQRPTLAQLVKAAREYHANGHDLIRDVGLDKVALILKPREYERVMKEIADLGKPTKRYPKTRRRR